jgi:hypothetical protein
VPQAKSARRQPRYYLNLHPSAAAPVNRDEILRLHTSARYYGLRPLKGRGLIVPNARYIFVRTADGQTLMHGRFRHPSLAGGRPVLYAGEAYFEHGVLRWWSNGSGHYRPDADHADQADLPLDLFRHHEDVLKRGVRPVRTPASAGGAAQTFGR